MKVNVRSIEQECYIWDQHYKCKRCKAEFKVERLNSNTFHGLNFCPYCGVAAREQHKHENEVESYENEGDML